MASAWQLLVGDARDRLRELEAGSVHTVVTSPPYFGLRDYGATGQIGLEPTPDEFVATLVAVFREVRRVLRDDGTCWLNLGDSYGSGEIGRHDRGRSATGRDAGWRDYDYGQEGRQQARLTTGCKPKDLLGIPWMVAFALRADGWYLRSDIVWSKPNPMPESVTDRPTKSHEYVFLLSKGPRYFYDADAIREPLADANAQRTTAHYDTADRYGAGNGGNGGLDSLAAKMRAGTHAGANKRSVWTVATQPYAGAHFATFPPKLIEPCILAGAPERACGECGAPWVRAVERDTRAPDERKGNRPIRYMASSAAGQGQTNLERSTLGMVGDVRTVGFEPSCSHGDGSASGVVLDPFAGAGTTGVVALQHGRNFIGIELNPGYAQMAHDRIALAVRLGFRPAERGPDVPVDQAALFEL